MKRSTHYLRDKQDFNIWREGPLSRICRGIRAFDERSPSKRRNLVYRLGNESIHFVTYYSLNFGRALTCNLFT